MKSSVLTKLNGGQLANWLPLPKWQINHVLCRIALERSKGGRFTKLWRRQPFNSMGSSQSSEKFYCNRYLNGEGPPSLSQVVEEVNQKNKESAKRQPEGKMTWVVLHKDLPGFPNVNTVQINYIFPEGIQTQSHPHPGQAFAGQQVSAYLPDNRKGRKVLKLLEKAFYQQLLFTVATNPNGEDVVTPDSIPLKTNQEGGSINNGYPDPDYFKTLEKTLKDKGIK
ncbi:E3 ubiquitin-protein ligase DTX3L1 isoform 1-T1 [Menidia menidia]